ncbi:MAG: hypothetical protein ACLFVQ_01975 [Chitinispirillaceae bacterium]
MMKRVDRGSDAVLNLGGSSVDSNRFYSILLDARAANVSENMYDIAEKLLHSEKDNAKLALDQLWALKKNMQHQDACGTIDLLIEYYQEKIDVLRDKEESIKKVSKDTRSLIEDKRKKDEEIATVKNQISDCTRELNELQTKLDSLKKREEELLFIDQQLKKEIATNESQMVNGLYEIILRQPEQPEAEQDVNSTVVLPVESQQKTDAEAEEKGSEPDMEEADESSSSEKAESSRPEPAVAEPVVYPKSVVKTTGGRIIGEYYYNGKVYKNERQYVYNSRFLSDRLCAGVKILKLKFSQELFSELMQMVEDAGKRVKDSSRIHFEVSTNEILNEKNIKQLLQDLKLRSFDEVEKFGSRLKAKIDVLGTNYGVMLQEQMQRCAENR